MSQAAAPPTALNLSRDLVPLGIAATNMTPDQPSLDAGPLFAQGVEYAKAHGIATVIADPGAYYFLSLTEPNAHFAVRNIDNMTIDLHGADLIFTHPLYYGLIVYYSTNAVVQNFTADYQPLPFTQARVTAVDVPNARIQYSIEPGWAAPSTFNSLPSPMGTPSVILHFFRNGRPVLRRLFGQFPLGSAQVTVVDDPPTLSALRPGDVAVIAVLSGANAIALNHCTGCTLRSVTSYSAPGGGVQAAASSGNVMEHVYTIPRPGTNRLVSTFGISMFPISGPGNQIRLARGIRTMDDALAMVGQFVGMVQTQGELRTLTVSGTGGPTILGGGDTLPNGSPVMFERPSDGAMLASAVVVSQTAPTSQPPQVTYTFDRDLPSGLAGAVMYTTDAGLNGSGSVLERSTVQSESCCKGLYIGGLANSTLRGNYINRASWSGIFLVHSMVPGDPPTAPLSNVTMANNVIDGTNMKSDWWWFQFGSIQSVTLTTAFDLMTGSPFSNLNITNNFIADSGRSGVWLGNTNGGSVTGNYLLHPIARPDVANAYPGRPGDALRPLVVDTTSIGIATANNTIDTTSGVTFVTDTAYRELAAYAPGSTMRLNAYNLGALVSPTATVTDADGVVTPVAIQSAMPHALDVQIPAAAALGGAYVTLTSGVTQYFGTLFVDSQDNIPAVNGCTYESSPASTSVASSGGGLSILVVTQTGCPYQLLATDAFVTPPSGATGTGVISVGFAANNGAARSTTIEIAGQPITLTQSAAPGPVSAAPASLRFAAIKAGAAGALTAVTAGQTVTVAFTGAGSAWTASANQPWLQITNGAGAGAGQFTASVVNPGNVLGGATNLEATITVSAPTASNTSTTVPVTLTIDQTGASSTAPFGQIDTPVQNATGVQGAIGVTGWTLDNVGVTTVKIYRNCLAFEPGNCQTISGHSVVFIGDAAFVAGARPDVEAAFSTYPQPYRAGWGYLLLTNMLPHVPNAQAFGGQGPITIYAFATDAEGNVALLGRTFALTPGQGDHTPTAITLANDTIAKPFGAIDTPGQGQTVSGMLANFGWVLTPDSNTLADGTDILMPTNGSTMHVFIDGVSVGTVTYNQCRGNVGNPVPVGVFCNDDVANIFGNGTPMPTFTPRTANATKYRNLDSARAAIGSFDIDTTTLSNGSHSLAWGVSDSAGRVEGIGSRNFIVLNSGANLGARPSSNFERQTGTPLPADTTAGFDTGTEARLRALDALAAAPAVARGSAASLADRPVAATTMWSRTGFDVATARIPVPADADGVRHIGIPELGRMELLVGGVDVRADASSSFRGFLVANGTLRDLPPGSHLDPATGVFTWAPGPGYIGTYRLTFVHSGEKFPVDVNIRPAGTVDPTQGDVRMFIDVPTANGAKQGQFTIAGWALDPQAPIGSGIDAVHVWAKATDSTVPPFFVGAAMIEGVRPDVAAAFGGQFDRAGYALMASLRPGEYDLIVYAHSARTGRWEDARTVRVFVR